MRKLKSVFTLMALMISATVFAQSKVFDNVLEIELKSSVEITNNKQIVDYALFYKIDKLKKAAMYRLSILDENLKEIGSNEFEGGKDMTLSRAVYESNKLMLAFNDNDKYDGFKRFVKVFDLKGKMNGLVGYDPEKAKKGMFGAAAASQNDEMYDGTDNIEGKGFISVYQSKAKTGGVDIQMIGLDGKLKWEKNYTADKGDRTDIYMLSTTPNTVFFFQIERGGIMSADGNLFLLGLSVDNGKELFKKPMDIKGTSYEPMMIKKTNDGKLKVVSSMFNEDAKFLKAKPIGFSIAELNDQTGEFKIIKDLVMPKS